MNRLGMRVRLVILPSVNGSAPGERLGIVEAYSFSRRAHLVMMDEGGWEDDDDATATRTNATTSGEEEGEGIRVLVEHWERADDHRRTIASYEMDGTVKEVPWEEEDSLLASPAGEGRGRRLPPWKAYWIPEFVTNETTVKVVSETTTKGRSEMLFIAEGYRPPLHCACSRVETARLSEDESTPELRACARCGLRFHFKTCVGGSSPAFSTALDDLISWKCETCRDASPNAPVPDRIVPRIREFQYWESYEYEDSKNEQDEGEASTTPTAPTRKRRRRRKLVRCSGEWNFVIGSLRSTIRNASSTSSTFVISMRSLHDEALTTALRKLHGFSSSCCERFEIASTREGDEGFESAYREWYESDVAPALEEEKRKELARERRRLLREQKEQQAQQAPPPPSDSTIQPVHDGNGEENATTSTSSSPPPPAVVASPPSISTPAPPPPLPPPPLDMTDILSRCSRVRSLEDHMAVCEYRRRQQLLDPVFKAKQARRERRRARRALERSVRPLSLRLLEDPEDEDDEDDDDEYGSVDDDDDDVSDSENDGYLDEEEDDLEKGSSAGRSSSSATNSSALERRGGSKRAPPKFRRGLNSSSLANAPLDGGHIGESRTLRLLSRRTGEILNNNQNHQLTLGSRKNLRFGRSRIQGWGVFADQPFSAGDFVVEYKGELIDNAEGDAREKVYQSEGISDYMFRIDKDTICDATRMGSIARFINHSCDPNCKTQIIVDKGTKKIGIFALRDVERGEELAYDYKFPVEDTTDKIVCRCELQPEYRFGVARVRKLTRETTGGAAKCKGFMN